MIPQKTPEQCFDAGLDCGLNGPGLVNCHAVFFATPELTCEWQRGKKEGERRKKLAAQALKRMGAKQ